MRDEVGRAVLAFIAIAALLGARPAGAQDAVAEAREVVADAAPEFGVAYAQMLELASTAAVSASTYEVTGPVAGKNPRLRIARLPLRRRLAGVADEETLGIRFGLGYFDYTDDLPLFDTPANPGRIESEWEAYSLTAGLDAELPLGGGFMLGPWLDVGVARLKNKARYRGSAAVFAPVFDGLIFNWNTSASLVTPGVKLAWASKRESVAFKVQGSLACSWIRSFDESDPALEFDQVTGVFALRAERIAPMPGTLVGHAWEWVLLGGVAGFLGPRRDELGFSEVSELGLGLQLPIASDRPGQRRLRLSVAAQAGPDVRGWTIGIGTSF